MRGDSVIWPFSRWKFCNEKNSKRLFQCVIGWGRRGGETERERETHTQTERQRLLLDSSISPRSRIKTHMPTSKETLNRFFFFFVFLFLIEQ